MRTTLFFIPHQFGPLPLFGWGWVAIIIAMVWVLTQAYRFVQRTPVQAIFSDSMGWLFILGAVLFFVPALETRFPISAGLASDTVPGFVEATETEPPMQIVGLPVRGYGLFLMAGVVAGVSLIAKRGLAIGISGDQIMSLAVWSVVGGMVGARVFFVVQKWPEIKGDSLGQKLMEAFKFTEGGLVVYGGLFGGLLVAMIWCYTQKVSMLRVADLATPAFLIGLALGRLGCLMNGCCYGGVCDTDLPAITFPMGSPPYLDQLVSGKLIGVSWVPSSSSRNDETDQVRIATVAPSSWAEANQLNPGDLIDRPTSFAIVPPATGKDPAGPSTVSLYWSRNGQAWNPQTPLPARSLPIHPSQIYASVSAALLCGFLFWIWPSTRRSGTVLGLGLIGYGISRILEEQIRVDELGQFGTALSISQWISVVGMVLGTILLVLPREIDRDRIEKDSGNADLVSESSVANLR